MTNEGMTAPDTRATMRSHMLAELHRLGQATADVWERAVFESLTGHTREDVDWDFEDNQAGYFTWLKSFDELAHELVDDGFVKAADEEGTRIFLSAETDPAIDWSRLANPPSA